jgi:hypothetical protein
VIALLKFNQQDDRINKHPKNQMITENNNKFGDRITRSAIALPKTIALFHNDRTKN